MPHASPCRTMLAQNVAKDRIITKFPEAYKPDATPYQKVNFHPKVKNACSQNKTGTVGLKICKAVLVGDVAVGKTCLVNRFSHSVFDRDYKATIGVDFEVEKFNILTVPFTLQVWDTAGQERFKCIAASYYRGSNVVIVVFDLSDVRSLESVQQWCTDACKNASEPFKFLVGTKKDLVSEKAYEDIEPKAITVANQIGAEYWSLSSKTGDSVREFFFRLSCLAFDNAVLLEVDGASSPSKQIGTIKMDKDNIYDRPKSNKPKCC